MDRTNKYLTMLARGSDGLVHQARNVSDGQFGFCMKIYTVCHDELFAPHHYVHRGHVTCIRCLTVVDYPHSIVTEEYGR